MLLIMLTASHEDRERDEVNNPDNRHDPSSVASPPNDARRGDRIALYAIRPPPGDDIECGKTNTSYERENCADTIQHYRVSDECSRVTEEIGHRRGEGQDVQHIGEGRTVRLEVVCRSSELPLLNEG